MKKYERCYLKTGRNADWMFVIRADLQKCDGLFGDRLRENLPISGQAVHMKKAHLF